MLLTTNAISIFYANYIIYNLITLSSTFFLFFLKSILG